MGNGGGGSSSPTTYDYHSGGGGGGLKLPGTGVGGAGAGGAGGGFTGGGTGSPAVVTGIRLEKFIDPDVNIVVYWKLNFENLQIVSTGSGYYVNNVIDVEFPYSSYPNTEVPYSFPTDGQNTNTSVNEVISASFKITEVDQLGAITNIDVFSTGKYRFVNLTASSFSVITHSQMTADFADISIELPSGVSLGSNSSGGNGSSNQQGAGGGGWGSAGGSTGSISGGSPGAAIESTFEGFSPIVLADGTGDFYGATVNQGQTAPDIFWSTNYDLIGNNTNTTDWRFGAASPGAIVYWGDNQFDTFTTSFSGNHQY